MSTINCGGERTMPGQDLTNCLCKHSADIHAFVPVDGKHKCLWSGCKCENWTQRIKIPKFTVIASPKKGTQFRTAICKNCNLPIKWNFTTMQWFHETERECQ